MMKFSGLLVYCSITFSKCWQIAGLIQLIIFIIVERQKSYNQKILYIIPY